MSKDLAWIQQLFKFDLRSSLSRSEPKQCFVFAYPNLSTAATSEQQVELLGKPVRGFKGSGYQAEVFFV